jgi:hypothetical protein
MFMTQRTASFALLAVVSAALLVTGSGCSVDARTSNQGGGTLLTASSKLLNHQIGTLTADEWQLVGDNLPTLAAQFNIDLQGYEIPVLTDEQAAAIVDFLHSHDINTVEELQTAIESGAITEADLPEELASLF